MKKVININFQGSVVPIEETSFELLKRYTDSLRSYFANEEGRDEIINDIESRIAELFQQRLKAGATCITDDDVNAIITNMGRPQDFADADGDSGPKERSSTESESTYQQAPLFTASKKLYRDENNKILGGVCSGIAAYFNIEPIIVRLVFIFSGIGFIAYILMWALVPSSISLSNGARKRLYRNPDNKIIAGVCSGIASFFNINVWIPRILFLIPFVSIFFRWGHFGPWDIPRFFSFTFSPGTFLLYVILWLVIPEASTTSEKLEMKGEKVDLESIKNSVVEEMKGVRERVSKMGKEAKDFAKEKSSMVGSEFAPMAHRTRRGLGDVIVTLLKIFLFFILIVFGFAAFGVAIAATGLFPLKDYILREGWQNALAWGTLFFFIYVPVIGIITWIIRRIAKIKSNSRLMRSGFIILWIVGWVCFISLLASVSRDFKSLNTVNEEPIALINPGVHRLEVSNPGSIHYNRFRFEPFSSMDDDTAFVNNVSVRIIKSKNDSFQVTLTKFARGRTRRYADTLASLIKYNIEQRDSVLYLDRGIAITENDKFRNQHVVITIAVPLGKVIKINRNFSWGNWENFEGPWSDRDDNYSWEDEEYSWYAVRGQDLVMHEDGLYTMEGVPADRSLRREYLNKKIKEGLPNENDPGSYRYDMPKKQLDSLIEIKRIQLEKQKDSLRKAKELIDIRLQKLESDEPREEAYSVPPMQHNFLVQI